MKPNPPFILCATDFSPRATGAATVAAKLALRRGEQLRLVHVTKEARPSARAVLRRRLEAEVEMLPKGGSVETRMLLGAHPANELLSYIRSERPSLVVVGSDARGEMSNWALAGFPEKIAEASPVPTLIVRDPSAFAAWDWVKARCSILLALDLSSSSDVVLRWAKQFQMAGPCDFVACHANWQVPRMAAAGEETANGFPPLENPPLLQNRLERELRRKVRDQLGDESVPILVRPFFGDPGPCVAKVAREQAAQLIVVGAHQRHAVHRLAQFSVSREVLRQAGTNVICIPVTTPFDAKEAHLPEFRRVLVATDFSELGNTAVPFACAACGIGGLVRMVHVAGSGSRAKKRSAADLAAQLRALIPHETGARCQHPEVAVLEDTDVARAICSEAEQFGADVVCLASHGLGASRALHGSVTKAVLKRLHRPLLIIRRPEE